MTARREKLLKRIDARRMRGLEFGALDRPTLSRQDSDIRYVDYTSTEQLQAFHKANTPTVDTTKIVQVDYVWSDKSLRETIGANDWFDYALASHVVEHVPDLITWFHELSEIIRPSGVVSLIVPDKRYTFDVLRRTTDVAEVVQAHLERRRKPSLQQIFDHYGRHARVDQAKAWTYDFDPVTVERVHTEPDGLRMAVDAHKTGRYVDVHCWVFTVQSFIELIRQLMVLELFPFRVAEFFPTAPGEIDFFVTFERLDMTDRKAALEAQLASVPVLPNYAGAPTPPGAPEYESPSSIGIIGATQLLLQAVERRTPKPLRGAVRIASGATNDLLHRLRRD